MKKKFEIAVLLAVYNGVEWIKKQIDSILSQEGVAVTIFISVDLSDDGSYEYLCSLIESSNIVILPYGKRYGGAAPNFFRLIQDVDFSNYDYVSFSDQDDIWNVDKLKNACELLSTSKYDAYSSNVIAFWENNSRKLIDKAQPQVEFDYLFESAGPGCTFLLNKQLSLEIQRKLNSIGSRSDDILLHDWFIYSFARTHGYNWYIDSIPSMDYRQHSSNQVGANVGIMSLYVRAKFILSGEGFNNVISQARILEQEQLKPIKLLLNNNRISFMRLAFFSFKCRRRLLDKIYFFIMCILMIFKGSVVYED